MKGSTLRDVIVGADGGVIITSTPEGGPSPSSSFVDKNPTPHVYTLNNGTLTDSTTSTTVGTGIHAVFTTGQGDTVTVNASDTGSYWLGGGAGADTLTGGAGSTLFLFSTPRPLCTAAAAMM